MAKSKKDKYCIVVRKNRVGIAPVSPSDAEQLDGIMAGVEFDLVPRSKRSLPMERKYWAILDKAVDATGVAASKDHLHDQLRELTGYVHVKIARNGHPHLVHDSTTDMKPGEYKTYFDRAMTELAVLVGYDPLEQTKEAA